jgi:hypothetical protein
MRHNQTVDLKELFKTVVGMVLEIQKGSSQL